MTKDKTLINNIYASFRREGESKTDELIFINCYARVKCKTTKCPSKRFLEILPALTDFWYKLTFSFTLYAVTSHSCNTAYIEDGSVENDWLQKKQKTALLTFLLFK